MSGVAQVRREKMTQIMLDKEIDLCFDEDNNTWYLQKFLQKPKYGTKESKEYLTEQEAIKAYQTNTIEW